MYGLPSSGVTNWNYDVYASDPSCSWQIVDVPSWMTISPASGVGSKPVLLTVSANTGACRTSTARLTGGLRDIKVIIGQEGAVACDATPAPFAFNAVTGANLSTEFVSNSIAISGLDQPTPVFVTGGAVSVVNGATRSAFRTAGTIVFNGDLLVVRQTSAAAYNTTTLATVMFGNTSTPTYSASFSVTTRANASCSYSISPTSVAVGQGAAVLSTTLNTQGGCNWSASTADSWLHVSANATGSGTGSSPSISVDANNSTASRTGNVVFHDGASSLVATLVVTQSGEVQDTTPDPFAFATQTSAAPSQTVTSNAITVSGINAPTAVAVSGGSYSVGCTSTFTTTVGTVTNGQLVCVRHTASANYSTNVVTTLTIGGVSASFTSVTISAPVNGTCGSAHNAFATTAPTANLCTAGTPSAVSGNDPWTWTCSGSNGGTNATCSTQVTASCVVNPIALNSTVTATLAPGCISSNRTGNNAGAYAKFYSFTLSVPTTVTISLSGAMDTYLYLLEGASVGGAVIASDDDGLGSLNSRIVATNLAPGTYTIEATTYSPSVAGEVSVSLTGATPTTTVCSATGRMLGKWRAYGTATYAGGNYVVGDSIGYGDQNDVDGDCNPFNTWWYGSPSGGSGGDSDVLVYTPPILGAPIDMSWTGCIGATQNGYHSVGIVGKNLAFTGLPNSQQSPWTGDFEVAISTRGPTSGLWVVGPDASGASAYFSLPGATLANGAYCADFRIVSSATSRAVFMNGSLVYSAPPAPAAVRMVVVSAFDAPVTLNNLQFAPASSACSLDLTADGVTSVTDDGLLINRYLMGFRGDALTAGISLRPWRSNAIAIEEAIGDGACFDVLARWGGAPSALVDGLILSRLMLGVRDDTLLNGITMPLWAGYSTASSIRAYVNSKFGTTF